MTDLCTRDDVLRLFGRAAFGATPGDVAAWVDRPYSDAVASLVDVPSPSDRNPDVHDLAAAALERTLLSGEVGGGDNTAYVRTAATAWLERMRTSPWPLEERMTLFLHDHLATGTNGPWPDAAQMVTQNQLIRRHSLGNFRRLLADITVDPAMLWWLNGNESFTPMPNENYARELMELFSLGLTPQVFTEADVREAARALTGWTVDFARRAMFNPALHDPGTKTILGTNITDAGPLEHEQVVDIVLGHPVASRFLAHKLVTGLAHPVAAGDLLASPDPLVARVAETLVATGWDLREAVRTLLLSDEFRFGSAADGGGLVRSPVEIYVHMSRVLDQPADVGNGAAALLAMGQLPYHPPNVSGWPSGGAWLNPATVIARYDWSRYAIDQWANTTRTVHPLPEGDDLAGWTEVLSLPVLSATTRAAVEQVLADLSSAGPVERQRSVFMVLTSSPEWTVI